MATDPLREDAIQAAKEDGWYVDSQYSKVTESVIWGTWKRLPNGLVSTVGTAFRTEDEAWDAILRNYAVQAAEKSRI